MPIFEPKTNTDKLYAQPLAQIDKFQFDAQVAAVFDDMISRSVPGYACLVPMMAMLAARYAQNDSYIYDLGCSLGTITLAIDQQLAAFKLSNIKLIAIDNAAAMIEQCQKNAATLSLTHSVEFICADIREIKIEKASAVVLNFTLQFITPADRWILLKRIYDGMQSGAVLILSEKITFADPDIADKMVDLHHAFKQANGYSLLEINQKRTALEQVLIPDTLLEHQHRLTEIGFKDVMLWFQCFNFISLLAWKN
jgi:tRNA (cmo5U34)-methyltransferase